VTPGSESAPGGGSIAHQRHRRFGIGVAGQFPLVTSGASAPARSVCSVMWGSASADRSITASGSLPRTPSPAFGLGPRLFRARHRGSSESPVTRSGPAGTIQPDGADPAIEVGPPTLLGAPDPPRRDPVAPALRSPARPSRRGSSEPQRRSPGPGDGALRSPALPRPPGFGPPALRSRVAPSRPGGTPHSIEAGSPPFFGTADPPRGTRSPRLFGAPRDQAAETLRGFSDRPPGPGDGALRSPALPRPRTRLPGSSEPGGPVHRDRTPRPSGLGSPLPRLDLRAYAPRTSGDRGRRGHRLRPAPHAGQDSNDRKATGRSDAFPAVDEGNSSEGANRTAGTDPGRWPPSGDLLPARTKRGEPSAGCGVQQTRNSCAEQTVMVVRNHEGGT
jgi:hypothetical protein